MKRIYLLLFSLTTSLFLFSQEFEELLPSSLFIRIHHSYMINKRYVDRYQKGAGGQVIMGNGKSLDVSRRKREDFIKALGFEPDHFCN